MIGKRVRIAGNKFAKGRKGFVYGKVTRVFTDGRVLVQWDKVWIESPANPADLTVVSATEGLDY